jgi:hypoxanthine phosphoribosyltransferase
MDKIKLKDKEFQISIPYDTIYEAVKKIASQINEDFRDKETPIFLSILNGAFMFTADLFKELEIEGYLSFVKFASYQGTTSSGEVKELLGINEVADQVASFQPREMRIATLLLKPAIFEGDVKLDYIGMEVPNDFIIGYGLDYNGLGRNHRDIYKVVSR